MKDRLNLMINDGLKRKLKAISALEGKSITLIVEEWINGLRYEDVLKSISNGSAINRKRRGKSKSH